MMKREKRTILELCRFADADPDVLSGLMDGALDYPYILGQLLYNRMGGAAYYTLKHTGLMPRVNREFRNTLEAVFEQNVLRTNSYRILLGRMGTMLRDAAFPYALLKGALLASRYPVGLRTSNDLDILVEARDIPALSSLLREHGFVQGYLRAGEFRPATRRDIILSRMNRGETVPFVMKADLPGLPYWEIDVNFSLDYQARETGAVARLLERRQARIPAGETPLYTLDPADFLLHLCAHLYKEASIYSWVDMGRDLSLYKFSDLYLLLREDLDEELELDILERAKACGLEGACAFSFYHTRELFSLDNPVLDDLLNRLKPWDMDRLGEIVRPEDGRIFRHDMAFEDWLFCSCRKERLYETATATA